MSALDRQVGGNHYQSDYQPIQFMADCHLNYIQGNILKYATRHRRKNGRQDLEKAIQYCEIGNEINGFINNAIALTANIHKYIEANNTDFGVEFVFYLCLGNYDVCKRWLINQIGTVYGDNL